MSAATLPAGLTQRGCYQSRGPWDRSGTLYFYGGPFSSFRPTPGLRLPQGWYGHPSPAPLVEVLSVEHYFHACKARCLEDFLWILDAPSPAAAKRRGGPRGERGRRIELRPDWEQVKVAVMRLAHRGKHEFPGYRRALLATADRVLVEDSPTDFQWGGRDAGGGYGGRNLLGLVLMDIRAELIGGAA